MLFISKENIIFIHIPKCGGTSIVEALKKKYYVNKEHKGALILEDSTVRDSSHFTLQELKFFLPDTFELIKNTKEAYSSIRNPYKRFVSAYFFEFATKRWAKKSDNPIEDMKYFFDSVVESYEKKIFVHKPSKKNINFFDWKHRHAMPQFLFLEENNEFFIKNLINMSFRRDSVIIKNDIINLQRYNVAKYDFSKFQNFYVNENEYLYSNLKEFYKKDFDLFDNKSLNII